MIDHPSSARTGSGMTRLKLTLGALVVCLAGFGFAGSARAESFDTTLDHGRISLGFAFQNVEVLPAPPTIKGGPLNVFPLTNLWGPVPPLNPPELKIVDGDLTGTDVTIGKDKFQPPIMIVPNPLDQSDVPITVRATDDLSGTFDAASGELNLTAPLEVRVLVGMAGTPPTTDAYCRVDLGTVAFTTGLPANASFAGTPFRDGITGDGAISGSYTVTEDSEPVGMMNAEELPAPPVFAPPDCTDVNSIIRGLGSLWLSHGIATPADRPACPAGTEGLYPDCVEVKVPCPAGTIGDFEPNCVPHVARITNVKLNPARRAIKAGKRAVLRLRVVNKGNKAAVVNINLRSRNKRVKVAKRVRIRVAPGKAAVKRINVKANRNARGRAVIIARGAGKQSKSVLKVRR